MKTGIDLVDVSRFKIKNLEAFLEKYYAESEIDYILTKKNKLETIAGIFAAKEAVLKAFKIGIGNGVSLKQIEICHNKANPFVYENETIKDLLKKENCLQIDINISHTKNLATAICIIN